MTIRDKIIENVDKIEIMTANEFSEMLNTDQSHVRKVAKTLGKKFLKDKKEGVGFMIKAGRRKSKIKELTNLGYTNQEICLLTDETQKTLIKYKHKESIQTNYYKKLILTNEQKQLIIGSTMGDAYIHPSDNGISAAMVFKHGSKQEKYIEHKYNIMSNLLFPNKRGNIVKMRKATRTVMLDDRKITSECIEFTTIAHDSLLMYREKFYPIDKKIIPFDLLEEMDEQGLAFWFMDDGVKFDGYNYTFCTQSFTEEDVIQLVEFMNRKFKLNCIYHLNSVNQPVLKVKSESSHDFRRLVEPYIIPSMSYKLYKKQLLE